MARILLVDDDQPLRDALRTVLQLDGHDVVVASNGVDAFELYQEDDFDLVVTDVFMPLMDGIELVVSLRRANGKVNVLTMSGLNPTGLPDYLDVTMTFGASASIRKPFTGPALLSKVKEVLAQGPS